MENEQTNTEQVGDLSLERSATTNKKGSPKARIRIIGRSQNEEAYKPVIQLIGQLRMVSRKILRFNRTIIDRDVSAFQETIEGLAHSWDKLMQSCAEEALKYLHREPQVRGDAFRLRFSNDAVEMSLFQTPYETVNAWLHREFSEDDFQHTETAGLIRYILGGADYEIIVWSTLPHTAIELRSGSRPDHTDLGRIRKLIGLWRQRAQKISQPQDRVSSLPDAENFVLCGYALVSVAELVAYRRAHRQGLRTVMVKDLPYRRPAPSAWRDAWNKAITFVSTCSPYVEVPEQ